MKQKKKSKVFTFLCSFLPGAAEMYMGFMKQGFSLMAVFFLSFMIPAVFHASDVFICIAILLWFYGFFHARNVAAMDDMDFMALEDVCIWEEFTAGKPIKLSEKNARKWAAAILILFGCGILWGNFSNLLYQMVPESMWAVFYQVIDCVPETILAIVIIFVGIRMILGKKEELNGKTDENA